jgi:SAM-dependent methyltransferase
MTKTDRDSAAAPPAWAARDAVLEVLRGYRAAQVLITCAELGVFEAMAAAPRAAGDLAAGAKADPRGVQRLLNAAASLGLVERHDDQYAIAPAFWECLAPEGAHYLGNFIRREGAFYKRWGKLAPAVRTGRRPEENVRDEADDDWVRRFELALLDLARAVGPLIADALALPEGQPVRALDVGGGHGGYCLALARRYPQLTATVMELPRVVPVAREVVAAAGLAERVAVETGDFRTDPLGSDFDLVLLFGVLVGEPAENKHKLLQKTFAALKPGGRVAIRDYVLDPVGAGTPEAALLDLHMLLSTDSGGLTTRQELASWLEAAGFCPPETLSLPAWANTSLVVARKP